MLAIQTFGQHDEIKSEFWLTMGVSE